MPFFKPSRFAWNEPWFFQQRMRTLSGWILFILFLVAIGVIVGLLLLNGQGKPAWNSVLGLSFGAPLSIWWLFDGTESHRKAVLNDDSIVVGGDMGKYSSATTYKLSEIGSCAIVTREASGLPATSLVFLYDGEATAIGIDDKVSLPRLARAIHDVGLPVTLDGWDPNHDDAFSKAFDWQAEEGQVRATAVIETLSDETPPLVAPLGMIKAIFIQCWAFVLWLALTIVIGYWAYQNWGGLGIIDMCFAILVPIGTMWVTGMFLERVATAQTSLSLCKSITAQLSKREGVKVSVNGDLLFETAMREPSEFAKMVHKIRESGYLQVNRQQKTIFFEGKKERWQIPSDSIQSLAIQEIQTGTPGQSSTGALLYFVVMTFVTSEGPQTIGFINDRRDFGEHNDLKRAEYAVDLFEAAAEILA